MENLKIGDLIEGEIYYCNWQNDNKNPFIFKANNSDSCKAIRKINNNFLRESVVSSTRYSHERGDLRVAKPKEKHWLNCCIEKNEFVPYEKAMETFNNETFAIELTSQEELNACMEYYKNLGYKENGDSHTYNKDFNWIKIDTKCKTWQTVFKHHINGLLVKTLKELGINQQNTQQYEVGKWYEYNPERNYAKLESFDIKNNKFYFSDRIFSNGEYADKKECIKKYQNNYWELAKFNKNYLVDLEVIQQYLPKSHPDKLVKQEPKQSYKYEVVHCETQEQWDFVTKKLNYEWQRGWNILKQTDGYCINVKQATHGSLIWYQNENSLIYSFNEWCNKFGHSPDFINKKQEIPEYVECIKNFASETLGKIRKRSELPEWARGHSFEQFWKNYGHHYKPSTYTQWMQQETGTIPYITGVDPYQNESFKVGDKITTNTWDNVFYTVTKIGENGEFSIEYEKEDYKYNTSYFKWIKNAKNNTTHVNKKVDNSLPENKNLITTKEKSLAHLLGIKKQLPNKTKRTQLTIIKPKQLKLN